MKKHFYVGQNVLWHTPDDSFNKFVHAVIIEKKKDHCLALTEGNESPGQNDLKIWIDEDTEMDFFDEDMIRTLSRY